jgi:hypothetical protein
MVTKYAKVSQIRSIAILPFGAGKTFQLLVFLVFFPVFLLGNCSLFRVSDENFAKKPLQNEEFTGFVSKEFFQIVVQTPKLGKERSIREERDQCKRDSVAIRNQKTIPLLVREVQDQEEDRFQGLNRFRRVYKSGDLAQAGGGGQDASPAGMPGRVNLSGVEANNALVKPLYPKKDRDRMDASSGPTGALPGANRQSPAPNTQNPGGMLGSLNQRPGAGGIEGNLPILENSDLNHELIRKDFSELSGEFAWFLDSFFLYKEDYSKPNTCIFVYRVIQKDLYEKIAKTKLSVRWKE